MRPLKYLLIFLSWLFMSSISLAQSEVDPEIEAFMKQALGEMEDQNYEAANLTFRQMLNSGKVIPTDMSFLFAHTLYMIHQYHNSQNFLDKYFRLAGKTGDYYAEAVDLKQVLDKEIEQILSCGLCDSNGYRLEPCHTCSQTGILSETCSYCKGIGITLCEVCDGTGVLVSKNPLGEDHFQTCPNCQGKSQVSCKICQGTKVESRQCPECSGSHFIPTSEVCNHRNNSNY